MKFVFALFWAASWLNSYIPVHGPCPEFWTNTSNKLKNDTLHSNNGVTSDITSNTLKSGWLIHGLWPVNSNVMRNETFSFSSVESIKNELIKYWSLHDNKCYLMEHEWYKHGIHSNMTQLEYFTIGLDLLYKLREKNQFIAGNVTTHYTHHELTTTLKNINVVKIICTTNSILSELYINYDESSEDGESGSRSSEDGESGSEASNLVSVEFNNCGSIVYLP